jgi:dihydropteroate synthase
MRETGCPVVIGASRKGFLGAITGRPVQDRMPASVAAAVVAALHGAAVVRVHDVAATAEALRVATAIRGALAGALAEVGPDEGVTRWEGAERAGW